MHTSRHTCIIIYIFKFIQIYIPIIRSQNVYNTTVLMDIGHNDLCPENTSCSQQHITTLIFLPHYRIIEFFKLNNHPCLQGILMHPILLSGTDTFNALLLCLQLFFICNFNNFLHYFALFFAACLLVWNRTLHPWMQKPYINLQVINDYCLFTVLPCSYMYTIAYFNKSYM